MLKNVVLLGGNTSIPGFDERLLVELQMLNECNNQVIITNQTSTVPRQIQPWMGSLKLANSMAGQMDKYCISKQDYEEKGSHYLQEHYMSNKLF